MPRPGSRAWSADGSSATASSETASRHAGDRSGCSPRPTPAPRPPPEVGIEDHRKRDAELLAEAWLQPARLSGCLQGRDRDLDRTGQIAGDLKTAGVSQQSRLKILVMSVSYMVRWGRFERPNPRLVAQGPAPRSKTNYGLQWHDIIANPTLGDAILDRIIHNAHRIELKGDSLRRSADQKKKSPPPA